MDNIIDFSKFKDEKENVDDVKVPSSNYLEEKERFLSYYNNENNTMVSRNMFEAQIMALILMEEYDDIDYVEIIPSTSRIYDIFYKLNPIKKSEKKTIVPPPSLFESFIMREDNPISVEIISNFKDDK